MAIIRVIDLESTHPTPGEGGLVEIGYCDVASTNTDLVGNPIDWVVTSGRGRLCNPGCAIPPETRAVHHISDAMVSAEPDWKQLFAGLLRGPGDAPDVVAFAAHGADFEKAWAHPDWLNGRPILDTYKVALRVWPEAPGHGNQVLKYWKNYAGINEAEAMPPHRAYPDAYVTAWHLATLLNEGVTIEQMTIWSDQPALQVKCYLGEYRNEGKGTPWSEVLPDYLYWIVEKAGFHDKPDIRFTAQYWLTKHEEDQREEAERRALNAQLEANGLPTEPVPGEEPAAAPIDERQGELIL
ncbi:MAG: hypothetical protein KIS86_06305 [Devosia sp.]|nr:hypothetical protein [Devosia sp.]